MMKDFATPSAHRHAINTDSLTLNLIWRYGLYTANFGMLAGAVFTHGGFIIEIDSTNSACNTLSIRNPF